MYFRFSKFSLGSSLHQGTASGQWGGDERSSPLVFIFFIIANIPHLSSNFSWHHISLYSYPYLYLYPYLSSRDSIVYLILSLRLLVLTFPVHFRSILIQGHYLIPYSYPYHVLILSLRPLSYPYLFYRLYSSPNKYFLDIPYNFLYCYLSLSLFYPYPIFRSIIQIFISYPYLYGHYSSPLQ